MNSTNLNRFCVILCFWVLVLFLIFTFSGRTCVQEVLADGDSYNEWLLEKFERRMEINREQGSIHNLNLPKPVLKLQQRGEYWVYYNLLASTNNFAFNESVTYTTHGDFTFLDNLQPLLTRWKGPVSIALYAPGDDFNRTIESIHYLRDCTTYLIREYVTFHAYFDVEHLPKEIPNIKEIFDSIYDCDIEPSFKSINSTETYKALNKLPYPVNVGRNIAKESSQTYFVLASDIELYPSENIIENFLDMIHRTEIIFKNKNPVIFPLNLFEVDEDADIPATKTELLAMLKEKKAIKFHQKVCSACHTTPNYDKWIQTKETKGLNVFYTGKRQASFEKWEPIYIGTKYDPIYDERLTWEGKSDKMTQGYILCVKDYDMMILDNAFLVHKPGIKTYKNDPNRNVYVSKTSDLLNKVIRKELEILFGVKEGCII